MMIMMMIIMMMGVWFGDIQYGEKTLIGSQDMQGYVWAESFQDAWCSDFFTQARLVPASSRSGYRRLRSFAIQRLLTIAAPLNLLAGSEGLALLCPFSFWDVTSPPKKHESTAKQSCLATAR